jgi:hypothetical protein
MTLDTEDPDIVAAGEDLLDGLKLKYLIASLGASRGIVATTDPQVDSFLINLYPILGNARGVKIRKNKFYLKIKKEILCRFLY